MPADAADGDTAVQTGPAVAVESTPADPSPLTLEFRLDPLDLTKLVRIGGMVRRGRPAPVSIIWHDTADRDLAGEDLALCVQAGRWRLEYLSASGARPPAIVAEAARPDLLGRPVPPAMVALARLDGTRRRLRWTGERGEVAVEVVDGRFASRGRPAVCRVLLDGPALAVAALAAQLAEAVALQVPRATLADQALAAAAGVSPRPRAVGAPSVDDGQVVGESLAAIAGHLLQVMLHWADQVPPRPGPMEPVHQMRVATRRLRSALSIFKSAASCPQLATLSAQLKLCAAQLGVARDWDVFLAGTGVRLAKTFPAEARCAAMLRASVRRQRFAYTALRDYLAGPAFRVLAVSLAVAVACRPWEQSGVPALLQQDTARFAAGVLGKRSRRVRKDGTGIAKLPVAALHDLRKDCKRLRYAAEFFAPLFPAKPTTRYLKRLSALQEELGLLNDGASIAGLMAQLGRRDQGYAAGLVEGFAAADAIPARARIIGAWRRFRTSEPFWT